MVMVLKAVLLPIFMVKNTIDKHDNFTMVYVDLKGQPNEHVNFGDFYTQVNKRFDGISKNMYGFSTYLNFDKIWVGGK